MNIGIRTTLLENYIVGAPIKYYILHGQEKTHKSKLFLKI